MLHHILIVDDDDRIRTLLSRFLQESGYAISTANCTAQAEELLKTFTFDIIILDNMMPDESGIEFMQRSQGKLRTPIIMLSALGHVDDKVDGLESGAEDYLTKPFEPRELIMRIKKILSRNESQSPQVAFGEFLFDMTSQNLSLNGEQIKLTQTEKKLLKILASNLGKIVKRDEILQNFTDIEPRTIDAQIARLRSKIEIDPKSPQFLQTIRGEGYVLYS